MTFLPKPAASQYRVSGIIEFSYHDYETKVGTMKSSTQYWAQNYRVTTQGDLWDPRFLRFTAGVGYSVYTFKEGQDSRTLDYNINADFFPGMKYSWNIFGSKAVQNVASATNIAGYDVTSSSYGGTLFLHLNGINGHGNNNNNNNNNNNSNNSGRSSFLLPDITLSHIHTENESLNQLNPLHEQRDNTKASLLYRVNSSFDLNLDGGIENYKNRVSQGSYDAKTANLSSNARLSSNSELRINGNYFDRQTVSMPGFGGHESGQSLGAVLDFKEKDGFRQSYRYDYMEQKLITYDLTSHRGEARVLYRIVENVQIKGGIDYLQADYFRKPTLTDPGEKTHLESGGALAGAVYNKKYAPDFMGPFVFNTSYDFSSGYSKLSSETPGGPTGSGWYYANNVGLGLASEGWKNDSVSLTYNYGNKRDNSPMQNDSEQQSVSFAVLTKRVPDTNIRGTVTYLTEDYKSETGSIFTSTPITVNQAVSSQQHRRSFTYDFAVDHTVSSNLNLSAGATRGQQTSSLATASTTLSTLVVNTQTMQDLYYAQANFNYPFTRNLLYRAMLREELRRTDGVSTPSHQVGMNLDYRIRSIFINLEARWKEDDPDNAPKTQQQYYYIRVSRPF